LKFAEIQQYINIICFCTSVLFSSNLWKCFSW